MIDQNKISSINLLDIIPGNFKKAGSTNGGEWKGACPWCAGKDRFCVWAVQGRYWCRGCDRSGNAIQFVQDYHGKTFIEACEELQIHLDSPKPKRQTKDRSRQHPSVSVSDWDDDKLFLTEEWQSFARDLITDTYLAMESDEAKTAREYLTRRGVNLWGMFPLGYNHKPIECTIQGTKIYVPRGIVIPWEYEDTVWRIRIRRSSADMKPGDSKYTQVSGCGNGLYGAELITPGKTIVMVEGEFDMLLMYQILTQARISNIRPVATGGTRNARLPRWICALQTADRVIVAFDDDKNGAGDEAAKYWSQVLKSKYARLKPTAHDVTDMWKAGQDVLGWIRHG